MTARPERAADKRPNIVFILTDDLGWGDLGCYGHPHIKTPNIDRLAAEGSLFTSFYSASAVCSPSRAAFLTGQYPSRVRIHHALINELDEPLLRAGMAPYLDVSVPTVARSLQEAGYVTGHVGKWHLGACEDAPEVRDYGYDFVRVSHGRPMTWIGNAGTGQEFRAHSTKLFVDEAIGFIDDNRDRPFFLNLWTLMPHATLVPTPEQMAPYTHLDPEGVPYPGAMAVYYGTVTEVDRQVGRILDRLDELGLAENTIVVFSSDNGPEDMCIRSSSHSAAGTAGPFRGRKRSLYDGGVRMPFIVRWPGRVPAGRVNRNSVISATDLFPTFTAAAGARTPGGLDGENALDILTGIDRDRHEPVYWEWRFGVCGHTINQSPQLAVREGKWKLLMNKDGSRIELHDMEADPSEVDNLADTHPDVVKRLSEKLLTWQATLPPGEFLPESGHNEYPWPDGRGV